MIARHIVMEQRERRIERLRKSNQARCESSEMELSLASIMRKDRIPQNRLSSHSLSHRLSLAQALRVSQFFLADKQEYERLLRDVALTKGPACVAAKIVFRTFVKVYLRTSEENREYGNGSPLGFEEPCGNQEHDNPPEVFEGVSNAVRVTTKPIHQIKKDDLPGTAMTIYRLRTHIVPLKALSLAFGCTRQQQLESWQSLQSPVEGHVVPVIDFQERFRVLYGLVSTRPRRET
ncbi:MAG: hypothetical protein JOS17DRAFT_770455 [Linnemannia elongata]|nr:MAG: hypothetical protein JOS17DRAFT_770455 [Linnemannia elongata]